MYTIKSKLAIKEKMKHPSVVIMIAGLYFNRSEWMQYELDIAENLYKPIIAVELHLSQKSASNVKMRADFITQWGSKEIIQVIKQAVKINV